jgi:hypothetical protein
MAITWLAESPSFLARRTEIGLQPSKKCFTLYKLYYNYLLLLLYYIMAISWLAEDITHLSYPPTPDFSFQVSFTV